jgi:hypothetical protein
MIKTVKYKDGSIHKYSKWWCNDKYELHRSDGPAIEHNDGDKDWYLDNRWVCSFDKDGNSIKKWFI